jgi:hypothetical protein
MYAADSVSRWDSVAVQATLSAGEAAVSQSRVLAIMHVAIHDALNSIDPRYERYAFKADVQTGVSVERRLPQQRTTPSLAQSLSVRCRSLQFGPPALQALAVAQVDAERDAELAAIPNGPAKSNGIVLGQASAAAILALRSTDHATDLVPYTPGNQPGDWQPTANPVPFNPPAAADHLPAKFRGPCRI